MVATDDVGQNSAQASSSRERFLEQKLENIEKALELIISSQTTSKGGPRKSSLPQTDTTFLNRLRSSFGASNDADDEVE